MAFLGGGYSGSRPDDRKGPATIMSPGVSGGFRGSDAQRAHIEAVRRLAAETGPAVKPSEHVAVRSNLGLAALKERKQKEEEEKQAKRDAARARRKNEATQQEAAEEQALEECEKQAWQDSETLARVKYEAALIVRIAIRFGTTGVWIKLAEARARGADLPLDPRRIYLLAHPDKCPMPEAADATAILNAQRPPEMTEARARPVAKAAAQAAVPKTPAPNPAPKVDRPKATQTANAEPEKRIDPEDEQELTLEELREKYKSLYVPEDIEEYWTECTPAEQKRTEATILPATSTLQEPVAPAATIVQEKRKTRRF
eukprot:TRINITY_DN13658_c0_g1_i1.p1 TRINITY_DN13658_c0_g1~~TRINITY_DN13658_c0_g1_i1.p1  ORF type:complete len:314 (-),score=88.99 TRINITY_DN13658_c0_g1_i1:73-1014(-)